MGNHGAESRVKTGADSNQISTPSPIIYHYHYLTSEIYGKVLLPAKFHNGEVSRWDVIRNDKLIVGCRIDDASS